MTPSGAERAAPPRAALKAFGATGDPHPLPGGQGGAWRVGGLVLKRGVDTALQEYVAGLRTLDLGDVDLAEPVATQDGEWLADGWSATVAIPDAEPARLEQVVEVARAFHGALQDLPRPDLLTEVRGWWADADRMAWDEQPTTVPLAAAGLVARLRARCRPLGPSQLVHGDLMTNVLVRSNGTAVVIDVTPYWRPTAWAEGVVLADALAFHAARPDAMVRLGVPPAAVARGLLFRVLTTDVRAASGAPRAQLDREVAAYRRVATALGW